MESGEYREVGALNHRIRRVLSVLRSVAAHMGARGRNSEESALQLSGRIGAIGRVALAPVYFTDIDLELLVRDEMLLYAAQPEQFAISGSEVRLAPKAAEWMSLVIHELAINAVRYGALGQSRARIEVAWQVEIKRGEQFLHFEWLETGVRMPAGAPFTPGFGCELVERLIASELKGRGTMTFLPAGARCRIEIPLQEAQPPHE